MSQGILSTWQAGNRRNLCRFPPLSLSINHIGMQIKRGFRAPYYGNSCCAMYKRPASGAYTVSHMNSDGVAHETAP